jgi:hypothetical protein
MATITEGINGGFSGKYGTGIGYKWRDINCVRSMPVSVSNPRSQGQLDHRAKLATIVQFLKPITPFLRIGFDSQGVRMSAFNAAVRYNYRNALTGVYPDVVLDISKVLVSCGTLTGALNPAVSSTSACQVDFTWENNSNGMAARSSDRVLLVVYNPHLHVVVTVEGGNNRASGMQSVTVPLSFKGDELQCYVAFENARDAVVSNSQYLGSIVVQ